MMTVASASFASPYQIDAVFPHDPWAFTQGLAWHARSGTMFESTGRYGDSSLRRIALHAGPPARAEVIRRHDLSGKLFGEGVAVLDDRVYQLTWREGLVLVYDLDLRPIEQRALPGEAWGLATDGESLIVSDGSAQLRLLDPQTLRERQRIDVHLDGRPLTALNDLEFITAPRPHFVANLFRQQRLARIDAESGAVLDTISLAGLLPWHCHPRIWLRRRRPIMNGLAWDPHARRLWVTGKFWPRLCAVHLPAHGA